jgi:hypothetical protein
LISGTRYGLTGVAEYARHSRADREEFRQAARALRHVGLNDEATLCELVAPTKRKPYPDIYERLKRRSRTRAVPKKHKAAP